MTTFSIIYVIDNFRQIFDSTALVRTKNRVSDNLLDYTDTKRNETLSQNKFIRNY